MNTNASLPGGVADLPTIGSPLEYRGLHYTVARITELPDEEVVMVLERVLPRPGEDRFAVLCVKRHDIEEEEQ